MKIGLQGRLMVVIGVALVLTGLIVAGLWTQQRSSFGQVRELSTESMHDLVVDGLRGRGSALALQLSESVTNSLYYFDLERIGEVAASVLTQPDVAYVLVFDEFGQVLHDGSGAIATYGQPMQDRFAEQAVQARGPLEQSDDQLLDFTHPVMLGNDRLGGVRVGLSLTALREQSAAAQVRLDERMAAASRRQALGLFGLLGLLAMLALGLSLLVSLGLVRPIRRLAEAAQFVEQGRYAEVSLESARSDELGDLIRAFARMSDSVTRHDRDIRRMAYGDALTGLPNRLALRELLDQRILSLQATGGELALLFIDLDDFKRVNDTLGHDAGDMVLTQFAARVRDAAVRIGGGQAELARFGGDEFVALVQANDVRSLSSRLADSIIADLQHPVRINDRDVFLGVSVGITLYPFDATSAAMLLKNGDIAMYQAKVAGKNCYRFYSRAMDQAVERRVQIEHDLRGAWERGEISLCYQPVYALADGRLVGAEALLRWAHPTLGNIPPSVFIDIAEQSGIIDRLGRHALQRACEDASRWQRGDGSEPPFVSVNISARQLRSGDLPEAVAEVLSASGLPPQRLHLELTETAVLGDEAQASALLARIRSIGPKVWLDDFGTGFSGLSHLRRVPVDGVKIDRSFIADMLRDPDDLALTTAIVAMAHSLGITVIAEGVEHEGQYAMLRERGCDLAQGYWLGRPMHGHELTRRLST
ncbi:putative bifunctional diguanylate cyclase/phosphodiesterase [Alkalisalibacterium limincola]|uniref:EAL domain-containing protein n=1 Tax=Alkalisalibacterium limincola TaxID=2699169 RepID=A0A5C8KLG8_9GAMM|nr:GGDEF domain-containing protein [Alkalisalibacterium limincola]TXK60510.1 EAL domain-containing protein [Alkalisalibacterium limincola]